MLPRWPLLALVVLAGCSHATLPYQPDPQPHGARVSADYQVVGDRLRVEIDTSGRRLEQAWILKPDGTSVAPQTVENPPSGEVISRSTNPSVSRMARSYSGFGLSACAFA